jgi:hypothetical protein
VTGFLPAEQVLSATRAVEAQVGAKISPAYVPLKRVSVEVFWQNTKYATMAAVPEYMTVKISDTVELNARYRDASLPCHFIPWVINRLLDNPR